MIAFYAVSNLAIVNAVNVKECYFQDEEADLYIRFVNGTALDLVEKVMQAGFFRKVFMINMPTFDKKAGLIGRIPYLRSLFYGKKNQRFVNQYLDILEGEKVYKILLTLHMDAHAVYFANYFKRKNKRLEIRFFEDGTASYLCTKRYLTHPIRSAMSRKAFLSKQIYEALYYYRVRKNITSALYIYCPQQYDITKGFRPIPLQMRPSCLNLLQEMGSSVPIEIRMRYQKKLIYYLANPRTKAEPTYDYAYTIIDRIAKVAGESQMIIKTHSNNSTENKISFGTQYEKKIYLDRNVYFLESVLTTIPNIEHKIVISRASTASMLPKVWLGKEPYLLLTFRLFPYYGEFGDPGGDEYVELLRSIYSDPSRVLVPNTLGDLELMLKSCLAHIYDEMDWNMEA